MRTFIAIEIPEEIKELVQEIQKELKNQKFEGKCIEKENIHLTLKFLGEVSPEKLVKVKEILKKVRFSPYDVKITKIGTFRSNNSPRIVWLKIEGLDNLQKKIDSILKYKFDKEEKFMAHLTIARIKKVKDERMFNNWIKYKEIEPKSFIVNSFNLMISELDQGGPEYSLVKEYKATNI